MNGLQEKQDTGGFKKLVKRENRGHKYFEGCKYYGFPSKYYGFPVNIMGFPLNIMGFPAP